MSAMDNEREPVAWRWMWPETNQWHYADYNLHPECDTVEPLYNAPDKLALAVEALEKLASVKSPLDDVQMPLVAKLSKDHVRRVRIATEALAAIKAAD